MLINTERAPPSVASILQTNPAWTDQDLLSLFETILVETMAAAVGGRSCSRTRAEAWKWIDSNDEEPFSFRVCATALGADPDELRAMFRRQAARLGLIAPNN